VQTQIYFHRGILILDDSTIENLCSPFSALLYRHWSGKQKTVVKGINLTTLLWTDGVRCVPVDYRGLLSRFLIKTKMVNQK
jgi:hypothetical protein